MDQQCSAINDENIMSESGCYKWNVSNSRQEDDSDFAKAAGHWTMSNVQNVHL